GVEATMIYLRNGYDLKLKFNAKEFDETIKYTGTGSKENNFVASESLLEENFDYEGILQLKQEEFAKLLANKREGTLGRLKKANLDPIFVSNYEKDMESNLKNLENYFNENLQIQKLNS